MKKIIILSLTVMVIVIYACTKENIQTAISQQKSKATLAGNKYHVIVAFKAKLQETTTYWWYKDSGSFTVTLDGGFGGTISNVKNRNSKVTFIKNTGTCSVQLLAVNKGNIDIADSGHVVAFGGQVYITFDTANTKTKTPLFSINCDGNPTKDGGAVGPGAPINLQFADNGQKQVYKSDPITITVTPIQ